MTVNHLNCLVFANGKIRALTTLRTPSLPEAGNTALHVCENPAAVLENRRLLAGMSLPLEQWVLPDQKHTNHIERVYAADRKKGAFEPQSAIEKTDGLYTTDPGTLIGVFTADCLGILFADPMTGLVGAVHSGWKGSVQGIVQVFIDALKKDGLFHPESLQVYFSPSLMQSSLEIGPEVAVQIEEMAKTHEIDLEGILVPGEGDRSFFDNQELNIRLLKKNGLPAANIHPSLIDTKTSPYGFSFRRDGRTCGEHFSCIWIEA